MKFDIAERQFRPVTITLETRDDFDKLATVIEQVASNAINHPPQIIEAAKYIIRNLNTIERDQ